MSLRVGLATIVLNERDMLPSLIAQHEEWPGLAAWCIVEGACRIYGETHPEAVNVLGLSTDGTSEFLQDMHDLGLAHYIPYGWADGPVGQQKCALRDAYCRFFDDKGIDILVVIDADEGYTKKDQARINAIAASDPNCDGYLFRQRHLWQPPSISDRPFGELEVVGGYWQVPHLRVWRWEKGARYIENHNTLVPPSGVGFRLHYRRITRNGPECIHRGFARSGEHRARTNRYYEARGEGREKRGRNRQDYVDCRRAWETWRPGDQLPHGAKVIRYTGELPEMWP